MLVIGVLSFERYSEYVKCSAKIKGTEEFDACDKCGILQCILECQSEMAAQLLIRSSNSNERLTLTLKAYGSIIEQIAGEELVCSPLALLCAKPFNMTYNNGIFQCVSRV